MLGNTLHAKYIQLLKLARPLASMSTSASEPKIINKDHSPHVFEFVLNKPKALNALDQDMIDLMHEKLRNWHETQYPSAVLVSGSGDKAFCAGGDIVTIYNALIGKGDTSCPRNFFAQEYIVDYALASMPSTQISIWNGITMGGGVGISNHAPIRIATDKTVYAMPETGIGFFCDVGGSHFLSRVRDDISLGLYLGITGHRLKGLDLLTWGVATHYIPTENLPNLYTALAKKVQKDATYEEIKAVVDHLSDHSHSSDEIPNRKEINECFQPDSLLAIRDRVASTKSEWGEKTLKLMKRHSPLSMHVVFEQIKRGQSMSLDDVFRMEYKISQGFMAHGEF